MSDTRIYTNVTAEIVNAGDMSRSLTRSGGAIEGKFMLSWDPQGGITNHGWSTGFGDLGLAAWWGIKYDSVKKDDGTSYSNDVSGFREYVVYSEENREAVSGEAFNTWNLMSGTEQYNIISKYGFNTCFVD